MGSAVESLPASEGSQIVGVIRQGVLLGDLGGEKLVNDDQVMILATSNSRATLGRIFAPADHYPLLELNRFFGEFVLHPEAQLADIAQVYGVKVDSSYSMLTVEQYFVNQFHGKPVVGDQVKLGVLKLIVREIDGDHIVSVGLKLRSEK